MALKLPIENPQGYSPEYHRITAVSFRDGEAIVAINTYKDAAARQANKAPVASCSVRVAVSGNASRDELYAALKELPQFTGAEDV
jgi:hypothetical protein